MIAAGAIGGLVVDMTSYIVTLYRGRMCARSQLVRSTTAIRRVPVDSTNRIEGEIITLALIPNNFRVTRDSRSLEHTASLTYLALPHTHISNQPTGSLETYRRNDARFQSSVVHEFIVLHNLHFEEPKRVAEDFFHS